MLSSLIAAEAGDAPEHADTNTQAQAVPGLALAKVSPQRPRELTQPVRGTAWPARTPCQCSRRASAPCLC